MERACRAGLGFRLIPTDAANERLLQAINETGGLVVGSDVEIILEMELNERTG